MTENIPAVATSLLWFYCLGFRLQQAITLHDIVEANPNRANLNLVKLAFKSLALMFDDGIPAVVSEDFQREGKLLLREVYEQWISWSAQNQCLRVPWSPARAPVERFAKWTDVLCNDVDSRGHAGRSWLRLGHAIADGSYPDVPGQRASAGSWQWEDRALLDRLIGEVGLQLRDFFPGYRLLGRFISVVPTRADGVIICVPNMEYPSHLDGWYNIEEQFEKLLECQYDDSGQTTPVGTQAPPKAMGLAASLDSVKESESAFELPAQSTVHIPPGTPFQPRFGTGYRCVWWESDQDPFTFTPTQAACVAVLWKNAANGTPAVGQDAILENAGSSSERLSDIFKNHPAWGTMIVPLEKKRGTFKLSKPVCLDAGPDE